jgi:two-component system, LytTR family, response regulator
MNDSNKFLKAKVTPAGELMNKHNTALKVAEKVTDTHTPRARLELVREGVQPKKETPVRIALSVSEGVVFIHTKDIIYCKSDSNYTTLFMVGEKKLIVSKTLKDIEELLGDDLFIRVHSSYLVNKNEIQIYQRGDGGELLMSSGVHIPVSRDRKSSFLDSFTIL